MAHINQLGSDQKNHHNPIKKMIEEKKLVIEAIKRGGKISDIKGIKIVNPL